MKKTALLIDANALLHRAWHALPPLTSPDGKLVNAVYGFTSVLLKILQTEHPEYLVVCWDTAAPTFRHKAAPEYKAQREEQPQEFYDQVPLTKQVVESFGGHNVELDGYEADDLLGTLAVAFSKTGTDVTIMTSDRDVWQLIGPKIKIVAFKKGVSETMTYDAKTLKQVTGLTPEQIPDYKALRGDASDNLKGVPGVGEKTATELIIKYNDLKSVFKAAHDKNSDMAPGMRQKLLAGEQSAKDTLPLVKIVLDAPLKAELQDLVRQPVDDEEMAQLFNALGFKTLLARITGERVKEKIRAAASHPETEVPKHTADGSLVSSRRTPGLARADGESNSSVETILECLARAKEENEIIIHPCSQSQNSLFSDAPELVIGSSKITALITRGKLEKKEIKQLLARNMEDGSIKKIGHGLKRAWHWCEEHGIKFEGVGFDTEIASYLLAAGEGNHDLESLCASKLNEALPQGESKPAAEADAIRELRKILSQELIEQNLQTVLERFELPLIPALAEMEKVGIMIDREYFKQLVADFSSEKQRLESEMVKLAGEEFNPASPLQLSHILFEVLKIPTKGLRHGKTGISTAASELEKLEGAHPIISKIGEFREVTKLLSTYVEALPALADKDGRVHTTFNQVVTSTGRLSSSNPNLQNIPIRTEQGRRIRRGFVAKPGTLLMSCDYSQIELRIVAALANDTKMLQAFRDRVDIHTATAATIWHIPLDKVTRDQRRAAKAINFGIIYGQGPQGLARSAGIRFDEAKNFIDEYFLAYSGIREYLDQTKALAHTQGYVETLFGRRRPMMDINSPRPEIRAAAERMAINMPVQGTSADIIKLAMIKIREELPKLSPASRLLLQVHDELVFEVPEKEVKTLAPRIVDIMENVEKLKCPIVVEAKAGKNWDEMVPFFLPMG